MQAQPECQFISDENVERYDGNCLMAVPNLEDFIRMSTAHSAQCGFELKLIQRDTKCGAYMDETWKCPVCLEELHLRSFEWVRTGEVAQGAAFSRKQPDINIRMIKATALSGIGPEKAQEYNAQLGIKSPNDSSWRTQHTKVKASIKSTFVERRTENRVKHNEVIRASPNYDGDVVWEKGGERHSTTRGDVSHDGAGCTRSYSNRHRGRQAAFHVGSKVTGLPLLLIISQVSYDVCLTILFQTPLMTSFQTNCVRCANALYKRIEISREKIATDQIGYFLMKHKRV